MLTALTSVVFLDFQGNLEFLHYTRENKGVRLPKECYLLDFLFRVIVLKLTDTKTSFF
jgi:hypothetical protein